MAAMSSHVQPDEEATADPPGQERSPWRAFLRAEAGLANHLIKAVAASCRPATTALLVADPSESRVIAAWPEPIAADSEPLWLIRARSQHAEAPYVERHMTPEQALITCRISLDGEDACLVVLAARQPTPGAIPAGAAVHLAAAACRTREIKEPGAQVADPCTNLAELRTLSAALYTASTIEDAEAAMMEHLGSVTDGSLLAVAVHAPRRSIPEGIAAATENRIVEQVAPDGSCRLAFPLNPARSDTGHATPAASLVISLASPPTERIGELLLLAAELAAGPVTRLVRVEQSAAARSSTWLRDTGRRVLAPRHVGWKLLAVALLACLIVAATASRPRVVTARAEVIPASAATLTAPRRGVLESLDASVGNPVAPGDVVARLDTADLELERTALASDIHAIRNRIDASRAGGDMSEAAVLQDELAALLAQHAHLERRINESVVVSPHGGVVAEAPDPGLVGEDLANGSILFRVIEGDAVMIRARLNGRDVAAVEEGTPASFAPHATPDIWHPVTLSNPQSVGQDGVFEVDARFDDRADFPPGVEGQIRIEVGRATILQLWVRALVERIRAGATL